MTTKSRPRLAPAWWSVLFALVWGHAACAASPLPDSALGTHWYTITLLGNRSGWSEQSLLRTPTGYESTERTVLRVQLDGRTLTSSRSETRRYDADLRLLEIDNEADQIGRLVKLSARRQGDKLLLTRTSPDGTTRQELPLTETFGRDLFVLQAVVNKQLKAGWQVTFGTLDCDLGRIDEITLTAVEPLTEPRPGWLLQAQSKLLKVASRTWIDDEGVIQRQDVPAMMGMTMQVVTQEEALAGLEPFLLSSSVPLDRDLGEPTRLRRVSLEATSTGGSTEGMFAQTARQSVTAAGQSATLTVRSGQAPAEPGQLPFTAAELQPFLTPSDLAQSQDARLVKQAREIIGAEQDAWRAACKLLWWVNREMAKVSSEPRPLSALEVLQIKRGDCTEHTVLMAALCQAVGLPARMVAGLAYASKAYHYHAWNEVYVGQWVEMDATWGEETVDAGHIQIASTALDSTSIAQMSLASSKTMGALKLKVLDFDAKP